MSEPESKPAKPNYYREDSFEFVLKGMSIEPAEIFWVTDQNALELRFNMVVGKPPAITLFWGLKPEDRTATLFLSSTRNDGSSAGIRRYTIEWESEALEPFARLDQSSGYVLTEGVRLERIRIRYNGEDQASMETEEPEVQIKP